MSNKNEFDQLSGQLAAQIEQSIAQAVQSIKQSVLGSSQEKTSTTDTMTQDKQEEILGGEAIRNGVITGARSWDANIKALFDKSQDYDRANKAIEIEDKLIKQGEERAVAAKNRTFQHTESVLSLVNAYAHIQSVADQSKFNAAVTEPVAPNTQDPGNKPD